MNGGILLIGGILWFSLGYLFYGRYLRRLFGVNDKRATPAHTQNDGVDYVPTKLPVVFGHHFASIAGAGPIVGPILGAYLGWGPVALWLLIGCVFIGAMHDFAALFISIRNEGRSIGHVIEQQVGYFGRQIFLLFSWAALILVVAIFALLVAKTFVTAPAVATASLLFIVMAPIFGYLVYRKGMSLWLGTAIFVPLMFFFIWLGQILPIDLVAILGISRNTAEYIWLFVLFAYVFVASTIPVWLLLQPRDYLNSYLLYAMVVLGFVGIMFTMPSFQMPAFTGWEAMQPSGGIASLFPLLFVTVACGACSGFHALVATGTTAKQLDSEKHILPVGYGAMLVEGVIGLMALISIAILSQSDYLLALRENGPGPVAAFAQGLAGFAHKLGLPIQLGQTFVSLAISAFMLTTLDTATRLSRFAWQELFLPSFIHREHRPNIPLMLDNRFVATGIAIAVAGFLAFSGSGQSIWPVFGASNQLLAALTLLVITLFLLQKKANFWISFLPLLFMFVLSTWALIQLFFRNWGQNISLVIATAFLIIMALVLAVQGIISIARIK
jgi:carbon starvation protein